MLIVLGYCELSLSLFSVKAYLACSMSNGSVLWITWFIPFQGWFDNEIGCTHAARLGIAQWS